MLEINSTLFVQILNFLVLLLLLNIIVFRPIRNIMQKRKEEMSSDEGSAREWGRMTEKHTTDLDANISDTRKKGVKEKDALKSEGLKEEQRMLQETHSTIEGKINRARAEIEEKRLKARSSLQGEIKVFSTDLAEKLLGRGI